MILFVNCEVSRKLAIFAIRWKITFELINISNTRKQNSANILGDIN